MARALDWGSSSRLVQIQENEVIFEGFLGIFRDFLRKVRSFYGFLGVLEQIFYR